MNVSKVQNIAFFAVMGFVTLVFLYLLTPFFFPIFWAVVIASIFSPLFRRLNAKLKKPALSAAIILLSVIVIIILPSLIIGTLIFNESVHIYNSLSSNDGNIEKRIENINKTLKSNPYVVQLNFDDKFITDKLTDVVRSISNFIFTNLKNITQNTFLFIVQFAVMLYTLFFFIRDGEAFLDMFVRLFSLGENKERVLAERFISTAKASLKVTLIIGGIQGTLGGFIFWFTGIEGALIWGAIMILMSIVPVVGCSIIWAPAGAIMMLMGYFWKGVLIIAFGVFVISMVDNLLRPILLGRDVQLHPLLIFLSTLGGISVFGISGFVIGPIIAALLISIWDMYDQLYRKEMT